MSFASPLHHVHHSADSSTSTPPQRQQPQQRQVLTTLEADIDKVKTRTVERLIAPLIHQITSLHSDYCPSGANNRDGASVLHRLQETLKHFMETGKRILEAHPLAVGKAMDELKAALAEVQTAGSTLLAIGADFVKQSSNPALRARVMEQGRTTLMAVARLLIMADMVDAHTVLSQVERVRQRLVGTAKVGSQQELLESITQLEAELHELTEMTKKRLRDLRDPQAQDDLQAAIAMLKITTPIMVAASKAYIRHPELDAARLNREYAQGEMQKALDCFRDVLQGKEPSVDVALSRHGRITELVSNLEEFQRRVYMDPSAYREKKHRRQLEELVERIASGSGVIADLESTREDRCKQIISGVNNLRQALQDLLKEYEQHERRELDTGRRQEPTEEFDLSSVHLAHKVKDLRRHLRRAIIDHVSDAFLDTKTPLMFLVEAARRGDKVETAEKAKLFQAHASKMVDVARLVCEMSNDVDGVRLLRYAALLCEKIAPQVVTAAELLCEQPSSRVLQENMDVFQGVWLERVKVLTMAMDSLISADDFIAVSESHIVEDAKAGISAIVAKDAEGVDRVAGEIRGRSMRICEVVANELDQLPDSAYSEGLRGAVLSLKDNALPQFVSRAERLGNELWEAERDGKLDQRDTNRDVDEMIDACNFIHDAVNGIRHALLMNRHPEDVDSDNEYEEDAGGSVTGGGGGLDQRSQQSDEADNQQKVMRQLPEESKREIQKQIDVFKITQRKFEYEVGKWDTNGNEIIALAKHMCYIMTDMTDFQKGRGPLRTTMDVIKAAQEISDDGAKLNALARQIGAESVESQTKKDLFAYLERITLFCHQLNVTSKVKADVQVVGDGELKVSGLEGATSLILNARNLLNAVILTVKAAFIASTKFRRKEQHNHPSVVEWRMAPPQKHPLVRTPTVNNRPEKSANNSQHSSHGIVRKASERRVQPPMQTLDQFHHHPQQGR